MRVSQKDWPVPQLTGLYGMLRVPRNLDCPLLPSRRLFPRCESVWARNLSHSDVKRFIQRSQSNTNGRDKTGATVIGNRIWRLYPCTLALWICLCFSLFLCRRTLTLIVVESSLLIEEFIHKMAISLSASKRWTEQSSLPFELNWFSAQFSLLILTLGYSAWLSLRWLHCARWSAFGLLRKFLRSLPLPHYACHISSFCPEHNTRRRSLLMLVLSHSGIRHLNRYIGWCVCHEILISILSMFCSWLLSINFLFTLSLSRRLCGKLTNSSTEWPSLWKIEVNHPSFNDSVISSQHFIWLLAV